MVDERMVPLLPCASVGEIRDFYLPLGFEVTYRQLRPYPCLALKREGIDLLYFGIEGFRAEGSYGSCLVVVKDTEPLFEAFSAGLRAQFGKLPLTGFPRITRPRRRKNNGNLSGFSLVDPAGNWIRVTVDSSTAEEEEEEAPGSKLSNDLANAVVFADSKGDVPAAIKILERGLRRTDPGVTAIERLEATVYLAELLIRGSEPDRAAELLVQVRKTESSEESAPLLRQAAELEATLAAGP